MSRKSLRTIRKRELRELVVDMRLRHDDEIRELLAYLPPEDALRWSLSRAQKALTT